MVAPNGERPATAGTVNEAQKFAGIGNAGTSKPNINNSQAPIRAGLSGFDACIAGGFTDYLVAEMRCASLRARILAADIEAVGLALKGGIITPDQALTLLDDVDALRIVGTPPPDGTHQ
jgi:hypothetical protein